MKLLPYFLFGTTLVFAKTYTLSDCLKLAEKESLTLHASKLSEQQADVAIETAAADYYPSLSANIGNTLYDSPFIEGPQDHYRLNLGITGSLILWNGGATSLSVENAKIDKEAARYRTALAVLNIQEQVLNAFYSYLLALEKVKIAKASLDISEAEYKNNEKLFEAGTLTKSDLILSKSDVMQKKVSLLNAEQNSDNAKTTLRQLLEIPRTETFEIDANGLDSLNFESLEKLKEYPEILEMVQQNYPGLVADSLASVSAKQNIKLAGKTNSIQVSLGAQASTGLTAWESDVYWRQLKNGYNHSVSLNISIPLIDKGTTTNKVLSAQIEAAKTEITKKETAKDLENNIETLYLNTIAAESQWEAAALELEANEIAFEVAKSQKELGAITYTDYLTRKTSVDTSKLTLTQAKFTTLLARTLLDLYGGAFNNSK